MKKLLIIAAITVACVVSAVPRVSAQTASFSYTGVPVGPVAAGSSFTIGINVVFTSGGAVTDLRGLSYWLFQSSPASGFPFSITNRNMTGSLFNIPQSGSLTYPQVLDPISRNSNGTTTQTDLGATASAGQASGTYLVANITFSLAANAPAAVYTIGNTTGATPGVGGRISTIFPSAGSPSAPIAASTFNVTVTAVPEPSTFALLALGLIAGGTVIYRRRSATV